MRASAEDAMRRVFGALAPCDAAPVPKQALRRIPALAALAITTVLMAAPVQAQTYDPNYPVCMQTYGLDGGYNDCTYTSQGQCAQSASGRAAQCISNPFFAGARVPGGAPNERRHRRY
jgi:Protein of unknown function (DUF3551)